MKYVKLFESFNSNVISKTLKYISSISKSDKVKFLDSLKMMLKNYKISIDKISDEDVEYTRTKNALIIRNEEKVNNYLGLYCLKFWFSVEDGYIGYTGTGNIIKNDNDDKLSLEELEYLKSKYEKLNKGNIKKLNKKGVNFSQILENGDDVIFKIDSGGSVGLAKIYKKGDIVYIIQNLRNIGTSTIPEELKTYGNKYYCIADADNGNYGDNIFIYKYEESDDELFINDDDELDMRSYNLRIANDGGLYNRSKIITEEMVNSDFCIVIYMDKLLSDNYSMENIKIDRKESKKGATSLMTDEDIRNANIERYINLSVEKYGISKDSVSLTKINRLVSQVLIGNLSSFTLRDNKVVNDFQKIVINLFDLIKYINNNDSYSESLYSKIKENMIDTKRNYIEKTNKAKINLKLYQDNLKDSDEEKVFSDIISEYIEMGEYINNYIKKQEIETIDDLMILYEKIKLINSLINNRIYSTNSALIDHIKKDIFNNKSNINNEKAYITSRPSEGENLTIDLEKTNRLFISIKKILN